MNDIKYYENKSLLLIKSLQSLPLKPDEVDFKEEIERNLEQGYLNRN